MTLAHPAAVVPLRRLGLPMTALVIGSMVPDIPLLMRWPRGYAFTHSLVGVFSADALVALLMLVVWFAGVRDALVDMSPSAVRTRLAGRVRPTRRQWSLAPLAACLGALTHVGWDAFTHPNRWGARHIAWLRTEHAGLYGFHWAQYGSGVVGFAIVLWASVRYLNRLPVLDGDRRPRVLSARFLAGAIVAAGVAGLVTAAYRAPAGWHAMAFAGLVNALVMLAVGIVAVCVAWRLRRSHA